MNRVPQFRIVIALLVQAAVFAGITASAEPLDKTAVKPLSPFGIGGCHINNRSTNDFARWIPQMAKIGIHVHRTCNTDWGTVEPEEGVWKWDELDKQMKYLEDHQIQFGAILIGSGKWNKLDRPGSLPVNNITAWSKYVTELAKHIKGRTRYFEVWNEPPNGIGKDQTAADYAKIVVAAYDAVKAVDPDGLVGLAAKSVHVNFLEQTIKAGAKDHFDYIILHPYEVLNGVADNTGSEAVYMNIVPTVRKMLSAQNPAKANVPIIFTELGSDSKKGADHQAYALVKAYAMGIAQGVACIQWFEGRDGDSGPMGLIDAKGKPRPAYTAMGQLIEHLSQHPTYLGLAADQRQRLWVRLPRPERHGALHAAPRGKPDVVDFGKEVKIVNPLTSNITSARSYELTVAPILILAVPEKLLAQAKANKDKPISWGGDYSDAKSVSITFGEKTIEKGLHTRSGADIAEAVVAYGGSAREGSVPGGNVFIVDPSFLTYTATPIEITVVVRRNPTNENAGFKLVYESKTGFKTAGTWYTIPDNKQWHTVKWRIDDPQFVNYWGYNFSLDSDGNKFNMYFIQSVTVAKLDK